ncbi:MAG: caspase family protein, partial [Deltaproteobacteria bacterium]|nr:caspase family protein [Deltaproteobacteria bacterium]
LRHADDDARALAAALADPARGAFDQIWTLTTGPDTSLAGVRAAMDQVKDSAVSSADTVVVYFSSHGSLARVDGGRLAPYLVLSDTRVHDLARTGLAQSAVLDWLETLPSRRRAVIFATCHSGQGKSVLSDEVAALAMGTKGSTIVPLRAVSEATVVIGASAMSETAQESDQLGHDVYTWYFLQALATGDADGDGAVTVTEAHEAARSGAYQFTGGRQRAWARADVLGEDPIILSGRRARDGAATVASYGARLDGHTLRVDGVDKGVLPGQFAVEPGQHRVEVIDPASGRPVLRGTADLSRGDRVDVERIVGRDTMRVASGIGSLSAGPVTGVSGAVEVDLPRALPGEWELVATGGSTLEWPTPTLHGSLVAERAFFPGQVQLRGGLGLQGWLLQAPGLVAPSLVPVPTLSLTVMPPGAFWARLGASGGWLWYADRGEVHHGYTAQASLVVGMRR